MAVGNYRVLKVKGVKYKKSELKDRRDEIERGAGDVAGTNQSKVKEKGKESWESEEIWQKTRSDIGRKGTRITTGADVGGSGKKSLRLRRREEKAWGRGEKTRRKSEEKLKGDSEIRQKTGGDRAGIRNQ